jgi:hypothetical protein
MAATIMGDAAITVGRQEEHLRLPTVRTQRPPVTEYNGLARAPILVVDLCAVFGGDRVHVMVSSVADIVIFMILLNRLLIFDCQTFFYFQILFSLCFF